MERLTRVPAAVYAFFSAAFYLTALGYVLEARGQNAHALLVAILAYAFALLILRAAQKPAP